MTEIEKTMLLASMAATIFSGKPSFRSREITDNLMNEAIQDAKDMLTKIDPKIFPKPSRLKLRDL